MAAPVQMRSCGVDTFETIDIFGGVETPPDHPLLQFDNVVLTPHVAAGSVQAMQDVARGAIENVVSVICGHWPDPADRVNPQVQPHRPLAEYDPLLFATLEQGVSIEE